MLCMICIYYNLMHVEVGIGNDPFQFLDKLGTWWKSIKTLRNCLETADTTLLFLQVCLHVCVCVGACVHARVCVCVWWWGLVWMGAHVCGWARMCVCGCACVKHTNRQQSDVRLGQWGDHKDDQQFRPWQYFVRHPFNYWLYEQLYFLAGRTCRVFPYNLDFSKWCDDLSSVLLWIYCVGKLLGPIILTTLAI